jgi:hypothetical protein
LDGDGCPFGLEAVKAYISDKAEAELAGPAKRLNFVNPLLENHWRFRSLPSLLRIVESALLGAATTNSACALAANRSESIGLSLSTTTLSATNYHSQHSYISTNRERYPYLINPACDLSVKHKSDCRKA